MVAFIDELKKEVINRAVLLDTLCWVYRKPQVWCAYLKTLKYNSTYHLYITYKQQKHYHIALECFALEKTVACTS